MTKLVEYIDIISFASVIHSIVIPFYKLMFMVGGYGALPTELLPVMGKIYL